jgi:hypothetical protein
MRLRIRSHLEAFQSLKDELSRDSYGIASRDQFCVSQNIGGKAKKKTSKK